MLKILSWNIAHRKEAWEYISECDFDLALLQEANKPSQHIIDKRVALDEQDWSIKGEKKRDWRSAVVSLNDSVKVNWITPKAIQDAGKGDFAVSQLGSLSAAEVQAEGIEPFIVISMYGIWQHTYHATNSGWIYADGSVHRMISDVSCFIGSQKKHRIIAAGDLNIFHDYNERQGAEYWKRRYLSIFERMDAIGLPFVGPQYPNGRQAKPWPEQLPKNSKDVPTFYTNHQTPATATRQMDFVFASKSMHKNIDVRALNGIDEWGVSDHCRIEIVVK